MAQPEMETTPSAIPAEDTQKVAQDNHPEPVVKIKDVEPRQEETLSAFEQELQKAHDSSPGLQALQALPGYENVFIEIVSSTAESVDENSEPTPVTDQEAQRMIEEISKEGKVEPEGVVPNPSPAVPRSRLYTNTLAT